MLRVFGALSSLQRPQSSTAQLGQRQCRLQTMADLQEVPQHSSAPSQAKAKPVLPDPVYEFSAPRFYDFATNSQDEPSSERADAWFDTAGTECKRTVVPDSAECKL